MRFPAELASVGGARRFVGSCLEEWGHEEEADIAVLLTSEVVTNAILHGGPHPVDAHVNVDLRLTTSRVRIEVFDGGAGIPVVVIDADDFSGRGLFMVDTMASHWGVIPNRFGKSVWFEVDAVVEPYLLLPAA